MQQHAWCRTLRACFEAVLPAILLAGCVPYLADQQSARILPRRQLEVTPSVSIVSASSQGETKHVQDHYGVQLGYGLTPRVELRAGVQYVTVADELGAGTIDLFGVPVEVSGGGGGTALFGAGVKFSLAPERVALYLPIGLTSDSDVIVAPTLLASWRSSPRFELTPSLKGIYALTAENPDLFLGIHLGAGISSDLDQWALRPEVGLVKNPGDEGTTWGFTLGVSIRP